LLTIFREGTIVKSRPTGELSAIEKEVIAEVHALRGAPRDALHAALLEDSAALAHHFILASHGNVQLRFSAIARDLGVEIRTLQRAFVGRYQRTLTQFQVETRLAFSKWLLGLLPPTKISAVAGILGYVLVRDFNRFFRKHMHQSPAEWGRKERERNARAGANFPTE
jgi:transcriptional regulator GlxA family with amidase domain